MFRPPTLIADARLTSFFFGKLVSFSFFQAPSEHAGVYLKMLHEWSSLFLPVHATSIILWSNLLKDVSVVTVSAVVRASLATQDDNLVLIGNLSVFRKMYVWKVRA